MSPDETRLLLHDLGVHQIELEMQNEELRRAQVELDATRARYFDLYDLAPVGYITLSEKGLALEANLTASALLGITRGELTTQPSFTRFVFKDSLEAYYQRRRQLVETGKPQAFDLRMVKKDGTFFWAHIEASTAQNADGSMVCHVVLSDITERINADALREKLEARNRELQKSESLGRMAAGIAHHFNNQLQAVMGYLELVIDELPRNASPVQSLTEALVAARKASEVSKQMLTYLGQTVSLREPMDLSEICRQTLPALRAGMPPSVVLETKLPSSGPVINANPSQIQQVMANLVANAWESIADARGSVRLTVKTVAAADLPTANRVPVGSQLQDSAYACLELADTGCGIADGDVEKLFDPFYSSKFPGRGLGLPVVLGIVRVHLGAITVKSDPARGSVFSVFFPVSPVTASGSKPRALAPNAPRDGLASDRARTGTMLVVEDEPTVRKIVSRSLRQAGYTVLTAKDGVEALDVFRQHAPKISCVLCDLTMPRMNGWETLTALRKLSPGIPVILCSGYSEAQAMEGDHPELPQAFLSKPYKLGALNDVIRQVLPKTTPTNDDGEKAGAGAERNEKTR